MLNSVLNGDWSNSVPGRKIPEGTSTNTMESKGNELAAIRRKDQIYVPNSVRHVLLSDANNMEIISKVSPRIAAHAIMSPLTL